MNIDVNQNTTSALFHEIGELNMGKDAELRGGVIDYENHVRKTLNMDKRPYDMTHSKTIPLKNPTPEQEKLIKKK